MTFTPGTVVRLKAGGPLMTVSHETFEGKLWCQWFEGSTLKEGAFNVAALEQAEK